MTIGAATETDAEVAAKLIAAKPRPTPLCRWKCARCANPQETHGRPPSPQLCARCRAIRLEHATEPATRPVYGDESEDDGLPITLPPAKTPGLPERVWVVPEFNNPPPSEGIQTDTPPSAPEATKERDRAEPANQSDARSPDGHGCSDGGAAEAPRPAAERARSVRPPREAEGAEARPSEEPPMTATAAKPPKAAEKKPETKSAPGCDRCGGGPTPVGRSATPQFVHFDGQEICGRCMNLVLAARKHAAGGKPGPTAKSKAPKPGTFACDRCGRKDFPGERERNGHLAWCGKKRGEASAEARPAHAKPGDYSLIHEAVMRAFPERAGKLENAQHYAEAVRDMSRALLEARGAALLRGLTEATAAPRPLVVRHPASGLVVECACVEDAAAFVRLVGATSGAQTEARG